MMKCRMLAALMLLVTPAAAQVRKEIRLPDPPGYKILKCDFHIHTVFSDGLVWPTVRVDEAWREGLDAIAITDHIEYRPHKENVVGNHNRPFELAEGRARHHNILLVRGAEITRDTPPGHFNVLFTQDNQPLDTKDFYEVFDHAAAQKAFIMWNHPGWQGPERGRWGEEQTRLLEKGRLHAIEICNGDEYYIDAHRMATERGLPMMGSSDIHEPAPTDGQKADGHRTMTLVLAKDKSLPALRDALDAGRTVVWYRNLLIGREPQLKAVFDACLRVESLHPPQAKTTYVKLTNQCDNDIELERIQPGQPRKITVPAQASVMVRLSGPDGQATEKVTYKALNFLTGVDQPLTVEIAIPRPASQPASAAAR
ncbi:MAG TPA: Sb-PDE family phosphodiesterase [Phycisphaerae bacterium]|nr:Sb-PDE family phosphodiesterase [Phycisphaerae bacterium]HRR86579.1 Sb-PDE family phosphodiesterase [Phycisphaerae bacterium]